MNIEEIKKKVEDFKHELIISRECCDIVDLSDDVLYLLSIIEKAERTLFEIHRKASQVVKGDFDRLFIEVESEKALQAIRK